MLDDTDNDWNAFHFAKSFVIDDDFGRWKKILISRT